MPTSAIDGSIPTFADPVRPVNAAHQVSQVRQELSADQVYRADDEDRGLTSD